MVYILLAGTPERYFTTFTHAATLSRTRPLPHIVVLIGLSVWCSICNPGITYTTYRLHVFYCAWGLGLHFLRTHWIPGDGYLPGVTDRAIYTRVTSSRKGMVVKRCRSRSRADVAFS